jgi:hypothetical protein
MGTKISIHLGTKYKKKVGTKSKNENFKNPETKIIKI